MESEERSAKIEHEKEIERLIKKHEKLEERKVREQARERVEQKQKERADALIAK